MSFHYDANKTHFHNKGFALSLVLKVRFFGTRKWPIALCVLELEKSQFLPNSVAFLLRFCLCYEQLLKSWNHKTALKRPVNVHDTFIPDGIKTAILMNTTLVEDIGNNRSAGCLCCNLFCTLSSFPFKLGQNVHIRCKPDQRFWFHT